MKHFTKFIKSYVFWTIVFGFWTFVFAGIDSCSGQKTIHKSHASESTQELKQQQTELENIIQEASDVQKTLKDE
jgi:hypothetical protein